MEFVHGGVAHPRATELSRLRGVLRHVDHSLHLAILWPLKVRALVGPTSLQDAGILPHHSGQPSCAIGHNDPLLQV